MTRVRVLLVAAALLLAGLAGAGPAAADPSPGSGIGLDALVGDSGSGSGTTGTGDAGSGNGSAGSGTGSTAGGSVPPTDGVVTEPVAATDASSELDVSGLRTRYHVSLDPGGGRIVVTFVVRNSSHRTIDATAHFWATASLGGHHVGTAPSVSVDAIAPGQSRTVEQEVSGVGQWTVLTAHMTLSPVIPAGAPKVEPVSRDRTVLAVPWAVIVLLLVVAAGIVSARLAGDRGPRVPTTTEPVSVA